MLAARGGLHRLVVDAGVGHADAQTREGVDCAAFQLEHPVRLAEHRGLVEIGAARVGDGRDAHLPVPGVGQPLEPHDAGLPQALGVGHDVRLRHRHEVCRAEEFADLDLVLDGGPGHEAHFAGQHRALFLVQLHHISPG
jgi:hypothetical protein